MITSAQLKCYSHCDFETWLICLNFTQQNTTAIENLEAAVAAADLSCVRCVIELCAFFQ